MSGVRVCEIKLVSWNIRGLGGFEKRKEVCSLVKEKCPFIVFLQETCNTPLPKTIK